MRVVLLADRLAIRGVLLHGLRESAHGRLVLVLIRARLRVAVRLREAASAAALRERRAGCATTAKRRLGFRG